MACRSWLRRLIERRSAFSSTGWRVARGKPADGRDRRAALESLEARELLAIDFGDAPDLGIGVGPGNYQTLASDEGPRHTIVEGLRLGARVDGDSGSLQNSVANADDLDGASPDDEDALVDPLRELNWTVGAAPRVRLRATNLTPNVATVYGWIDLNRDGAFDDATERTSATAPPGTDNATLTLAFSEIPLTTTTGTVYARFRLSSDLGSSSAMGAAADGEVEDYTATIGMIADGLVDPARSRIIADGVNGGPTLLTREYFGASLASLGDLDGDGVGDLAVGASGNDDSASAGGGVYVLFLTSDGASKRAVKIGSRTNGGPALRYGDLFGISVASLGDLDGDGIVDLAVGAVRDDNGGTDRGAVHLLFLNQEGAVARSVKIASGLNGGPTLSHEDLFGSSVTSLGDLDGDGVTDLAVGASGGVDRRGAVHLLFLNTDGTVKRTLKIADGVNGGPSLTVGDYFGSSVAAMGDLDSDGVGELAVGARFDDTNGWNRGAVYVLFLNTDGTAKRSIKIASGVNGGPTLAHVDEFGVSIASLGDADGDGVTDLLVGSRRDDAGGRDNGAVTALFLNVDGTVKRSLKIASNLNGGPSLASEGYFGFGSSVALLGDQDGDGVANLAVGAPRIGDIGRGAVYVLSLKPDSTPPALVSLARQMPASAATNADAITFRATFDEEVVGLLDSSFVVDGGTSAVVTSVRQVTAETFDVTVLGGDLAGFNGVVGLNLANDQTIVDRFGYALPNAEPLSDETYLVDNVRPIFESLVRRTPLSSVTSANALRFRAAFSEAVEQVDPGDFVLRGVTATISVVRISGRAYDLVVSGGNLEDWVGTIGIDLASGHNIVDSAGNSLETAEPPIDETFALVASVTDFGDAPDNGVGTSAGNYQTTLADDGPRHVVVPGLKLGAHVDVEPDSPPSDGASADDSFAFPDRDDEDGLFVPNSELSWTLDAAPRIGVRATNLTMNTATLYGWIDVNRDGAFDNHAERASVTVPTGTDNVLFTLAFPRIPVTTSPGKTFARFRLSSDLAAANSTGAAADGEVEDYHAVIRMVADGLVDSGKTIKIPNGVHGAPALADVEGFGTSVASLGDLDGDGVAELAVGAHGAVHVLFLNSSGAIRKSLKIADGVNGGPNLPFFLKSRFGSFVTSLGDLDADGVPDMAVGALASGLPAGGVNTSRVYVLFLNPDGTAKRSLEIATGVGSVVGRLLNIVSVASLGDLDGDGVGDLVVGSPQSQDGAVGAVYVLFLNFDGTPKRSVNVASRANGGPSLPRGDQFGVSLASLGDLDGDGTVDLAVGSQGEGARGAVSVMFLRTDGTVKRWVRIDNGFGGGPQLVYGDLFGSSIASLGDLDGDGHVELAVGARLDRTGGGRSGAMHILFLNSDGTARRSVKIARGIGGGPALADGANFGASVAFLGDLDGDGVSDLAVGAWGDAPHGALYMMFLKPGAFFPLSGDYDVDRDIGGADFLAWQRAFGAVADPSGSGADGDSSGAIDAGDLNVWQTALGVPSLAPVSGDYDADRDVDGGDFLAWQRTVGKSAVPIGLGADGDSSGTIDVGDFNVWQTGFGNQLSPPVAGNYGANRQAEGDASGASEESHFDVRTRLLSGRISARVGSIRAAAATPTAVVDAALERSDWKSLWRPTFVSEAKIRRRTAPQRRR